MTEGIILPWPKGENEMNIEKYFNQQTAIIEAAFPDRQCVFSVANYGTEGDLTFFLHADSHVGTGRTFLKALVNLEETIEKAEAAEATEGSDDDA